MTSSAWLSSSSSSASPSASPLESAVRDAAALEPDVFVAASETVRRTALLAAAALFRSAVQRVAPAWRRCVVHALPVAVDRSGLAEDVELLWAAADMHNADALADVRSKLDKLQHDADSSAHADAVDADADAGDDNDEDEGEDEDEDEGEDEDHDGDGEDDDDAGSDHSDEYEDVDDGDAEDVDDEDEDEDVAVDSRKRKQSTARPGKRSVVDTPFFSLEEMHRFADAAEREYEVKRRRREAGLSSDEDDSGKADADDLDDAFGSARPSKQKPAAPKGKSKSAGGDSDDDEIDLFSHIPDSDDEDSAADEEDEDADDEGGDHDGARTLRYADFFDPPVGVTDAPDAEGVDEVSDEDGAAEENADDAGETEKADEEEDGAREDDGRDLSSFERWQLRMREEITGLEGRALAGRSWQMMGETSARKREENALMAEDLEFERSLVTAPAVTVETTKTLEDLIRRRIRDRVFDDVQSRALRPSTCVCLCVSLCVVSHCLNALCWLVLICLVVQHFSSIFRRGSREAPRSRGNQRGKEQEKPGRAL
jgi:U3 small nucleolar ribonucleoprotein component